MKNYLVLLIGCMVMLNLQAQSKSSIETTIRQQEQMVAKAIVDADTNLLKRLWSPEFIVNTPRNTIAENRNAVLAIQRAGMMNYLSFEKVVERVLVQDNIVIVMGNETYVPRADLPDAKAGEMVKRRFTNIWVKQDGNWVQTGRHASVICR